MRDKAQKNDERAFVQKKSMTTYFFFHSLKQFHSYEPASYQVFTFPQQKMLFYPEHQTNLICLGQDVHVILS